MTINESNRRWWTLGAMCFALFMIMLDNTVVNVALPSIQDDLNTDLSTLEWTINAYTLVFGTLLVTGGRLGDIFGRRRMFLFGVIVFGASSAALSFAPSDTFLIVGRAIQGVGAAFMMPATLSIITNAFPAHERGKAIGTWAGVSAIALAIGPMVGGALVENVGWRAIFYINIPVAILAVIVTLWAARESRDETAERRVDIPGVLTLGVGIGAVVLALIEGNAWGWTSAGVLGLFALSIVSLTAFVFTERHVRVPMLDFSYFKSRQFLGANLVAFLVSFAMFGMFLYLALYMQNILGYSPFEAGLAFLPSTGVIMFVGPVAGRLSDKIGSRPLIITGLLIVAASLLWQSFVQTDTEYLFLLFPFILMGVGIGLVMSPMSTAAMNSVDRTKAGAASGVLSMIRMVGGTFGVAIVGAVVLGAGGARLEELLPRVPDAQREKLTEALGSGGNIGVRLPPDVTLAMNEAYVYALDNALKISALMAAIGAVVAWFLLDRRRPAHAHAEDELVADAAAGTPALEQAEAAEEAVRA